MSMPEGPTPREQPVAPASLEPAPPRRSRVAALLKALSVLALLAAAAAVGGAVLAWRHFAGGLPDVPTLAQYRPPTVTELVSSDGQLAGELFDERRKVVPFERIPTKLVQALLASEDKNFFEHGGIDWAGTLRAAVNTYLLRHKVQGGSTITQQTAKSLLISAEGFEAGHEAEPAPQAPRAHAGPAARDGLLEARRSSGCTSTASSSATTATGCRRRRRTTSGRTWRT